MPVSTNLEIYQILESQAAKATAANTAIGAVEKAMSDEYNLDTSSATAPGTDLTLPYDNTNDLSDRTALRFIQLTLDAGATATFNVIHPPNRHMFFCTNNTSQTATLKCTGQTGVTIANGASGLFYCNGTDVAEIDMSVGGGGVSFPTELQMNYYGSPPATTVIAKFIIADPIDFAANFAGSVGNVPVNPGAQYDIDVQDDGGSIGTISISSGGVFTFTTTGGTSKNAASGSIITLVSDATPDGALTEIHVALRGTI